MPQTSLALLAAGLVSGLILSWPSDLSAPPAHRLARAAGVGRAVTPTQKAAADSTLAEPSVADDLEGCAPFLAIDGGRVLDFDSSRGKVVETVAPSPRQGRGGAPPTRRIGTFSTAERTSRVVIVLAGVRREYTLIIPADGTQCILALGAPHAVNMERSWFGGQASDGADFDPPTYEHAAAPRFPGGRGARRHDGRPARSVRHEQVSQSSSL
jgi:hypothetical protein